MHTTLTIGITTGTYKEYRKVMVDPQEWIENAVKHRAHTATVDIVRDYTVYKTTKNQPIVAVGSTAVVQAALDEGTAKFLEEDG